VYSFEGPPDLGARRYKIFFAYRADEQTLDIITVGRILHE